MALPMSYRIITRPFTVELLTLYFRPISYSGGFISLEEGFLDGLDMNSSENADCVIVILSNVHEQSKFP